MALTVKVHPKCVCFSGLGFGFWIPNGITKILNQIAPQVKGIIYPPPDIRAIVDKTARFVAKNGKSFEERIQASEEGKSAKFNFMRPHDPYYAYYEFKIRDFEENGDAPKPVRGMLACTTVLYF